jgi:hypothetical protein
LSPLDRSRLHALNDIANQSHFKGPCHFLSFVTYPPFPAASGCGFPARATCLSSPASAQDGDPLVTLNPMNAITVTATRRPTTIGEVPATVSVITDRQILTKWPPTSRT